MRPRVLPLLLLLVASTLAPMAHAARTSEPAGNDWVEATLDLAQPSLTHIDITGTFLVHKYLVQGSEYTASDMSDAYAGANRFGAKTGQAFVDQIASDVRVALEAQLEKDFPTATTPMVTSVIVDKSSLTATRVDAFDPPISIAIAASVQRTNADLGLGSLTSDGVAAAFASGARVATSLSLTADPGYQNAFTLHAPASPTGLVLSELIGATPSADDRSATLTVDATQSPATVVHDLSLALKDGGATAPSAEDVRTLVDIKLGELKPNATTLPIATTVTSELRAVSVGQRFASALPSGVTLPFVSADAIRGLHAAGVIRDADLKQASDSMVSEVKTQLDKALNSTTTASGGFAPADLPTTSPARPYHAEPPVHVVVSAQNAFPLPGPQAKNLDLAIAIGATVKFDINLYSGPKDSTFVIHAPPGTVLTDARGGTISSDKSSATYVVPANAASPTVGLAMRGATAPVVTKEQADLGVKVDLQDLDVSIGKALGGDFGNLVVAVDVTGALGAVSVAKLPDNVKAQLSSPNLQLDYITSDAVRLALQRGLVTQKDLDDMQTKLLTETTQNLASSMGGPVRVIGGFDSTSLSPGASGGSPIAFRAHAAFTKPVKGGAPTDVQAVALYTVQQSFQLPKVQGLDTTYTIILPRGLALGSVSAPGAGTSTGTAPDGRAQLVVTPSGDSTTATVAIAITPTFVFIKFWPLVLAVVVLLVLVIGTPIALVMARRRKHRGGEQPKK